MDRTIMKNKRKYFNRTQNTDVLCVKEALQLKYENLNTTLNPKDIIPKLFQEQIINQSEKERLGTAKGPTNQSSLLLDILISKGETEINAFMDILKERQPYVYQPLHETAAEIKSRMIDTQSLPRMDKIELPPLKRARHDDLCGYVVDITKINTGSIKFNNTNGCRYFNFILQTEPGVFEECVSFQPQLHREAVRICYYNKHPLLLQNYQRSVVPWDQDSIQLGFRAVLKVAKEIFLPFVKEETKWQRVKLEELPGMKNYTKISIDLKILRKVPVKTREKDGQTSVSYYVSDATGQSQIEVFGKELNMGTSYSFTGVTMKSYLDTFNLMTSEWTSWETIPNLEGVVPDEPGKDIQNGRQEDVLATAIGYAIMKKSNSRGLQCVACDSTNVHNTGNSKMSCAECGMRFHQRYAVVEYIKAKAVMKIGHKKLEMKITKPAIKAFLSALQIDISLSASEIEDKLLDHSDVKISFVNGYITYMSLI